jgi:hypothetical protein
MKAQPVRLQLSISPGFHLQAASLAANGLPAVNVARPSKWGNKVARRLALSKGDAAVAAFRSWLENDASEKWKEEARDALRGKNLACWCALDAPCHADVLLAFANDREANSGDASPGVIAPKLSCDSPG